MALTAFTSRLGRGQGRLATSKATGGDYAFVLGDAEPGRRLGVRDLLAKPLDLDRVAATVMAAKEIGTC